MMTKPIATAGLAGLLGLGLVGCLEPDAGVVATYSLHPDQSDVQWPGGVVPFAVTPSFTNSPDLMSSLVAAQDFYGQVSKLVFVQDQSLLTAIDKPGIVYSISPESKSDKCPGGITTLRTNSNDEPSGSNIAMCATSGRQTTLHETGHALGFAHEQSRPDRDKHVLCHAENMDPKQLEMCGTDAAHPNVRLGSGVTWAECVADPCNLSPQFRRVPGSPTVYGDYDLASMMEYPSGFFSIDPDKVTLTKKSADPAAQCNGEPGDCIPSPNDLSIGDINTLLQLYEEPLQANASGAAFGTSIAVGDFDGDGFDDVAVGAPGAASAGKVTGAIFLYKGTPGRRTITGTSIGPTDWTTNLVPWKVLHPSDFGKSGQEDEQFGASLKALDLSGHSLTADNHKVLDLAIGAPGRDRGVGAVYVAYGHEYKQKNPNGMFGMSTATLGLQTLGADLPPTYYPESAFSTTTSTSDHFGAAIAGANFDTDDLNELAIGAPGANRVALLKHASGATTMTLRKMVVPAHSLFVRDFGRSLTTIDLDGDGKSDLVVGAPMSDEVTVNTGAVFAFTSMNAFLETDSTIGPSPESQAWFGSSLAAGHYFANGAAQIAIGAPGRGGVGRVFVYQWSGGFSATPQQIGQTIVSGETAASGDRFGAALRTARLHGGSHDDLVVGVPGKSSNTGAALALTATTTAFTGGIVVAHPPVSGTGFGGALSSGDLDNDGNVDLIIGAVGESPTGAAGGAITARQGSANGLTNLSLWRFPAFKLEQN